MSDSAPELEHFSNPDVVAATAVRLRRLQLRLYEKAGVTGRIVTPTGRRALERQMAECNLVSQIAWALEEGRLVILSPTEDVMAARMAADIDMHFGVYQPPPPGQEQEQADGS